MAQELGLKDALSMFVQGAKDYGLSRAISDAQTKVQEIKMAGLKDAEQRRALGELAQGLTGQLVGMGVSPMNVAQASGAVNAPQYGSADQAILQGTLNGDQFAVESGRSAQMMQREDEVSMLRNKAGIAEASQRRLFDHQDQLAEMRAGMKPPTADQFKVAGFAKRMDEAESVFTNLEKQGFNRADKLSAIGSNLPNVMQTKFQQMQSQAERNFINATLRRESGAAISKEEFANGKEQYFPQAGDDPEVLEQKRKNRMSVIQSFAAEGSPALSRIGSPSPSSAAPALPKGFKFVK